MKDPLGNPNYYYCWLHVTTDLHFKGRPATTFTITITLTIVVVSVTSAARPIGGDLGVGLGEGGGFCRRCFSTRPGGVRNFGVAEAGVLNSSGFPLCAGDLSKNAQPVNLDSFLMPMSMANSIPGRMRLQLCSEKKKKKKMQQ